MRGQKRGRSRKSYCFLNWSIITGIHVYWQAHQSGEGTKGASIPGSGDSKGPTGPGHCNCGTGGGQNPRPFKPLPEPQCWGCLGEASPILATSALSPAGDTEPTPTSPRGPVRLSAPLCTNNHWVWALVLCFVGNKYGWTPSLQIWICGLPAQFDQLYWLPNQNWCSTQREHTHTANNLRVWLSAYD